MAWVKNVQEWSEEDRTLGCSVKWRTSEVCRGKWLQKFDENDNKRMPYYEKTRENYFEKEKYVTLSTIAKSSSKMGKK